MYSQLVSHALAERDPYDGDGDAELFETVVRLRAALPVQPTGSANGSNAHDGVYGGGDPRYGSGGVTSRVADEVAYDVALVTLCRRLGVEHDPECFDRPDVERRALERELACRGFDVTR